MLSNNYASMPLMSYLLKQNLWPSTWDSHIHYLTTIIATSLLSQIHSLQPGRLSSPMSLHFKQLLLPLPYKSKNSFAKTPTALFNSGTAPIKPNGPDTNLLTKLPRNHTHNYLSPAKTLFYSVERRSVMT